MCLGAGGEHPAENSQGHRREQAGQTHGQTVLVGAAGRWGPQNLRLFEIGHWQAAQGLTSLGCILVAVIFAQGQHFVHDQSQPDRYFRIEGTQPGQGDATRDLVDRTGGNPTREQVKKGRPQAVDVGAHVGAPGPLVLFQRGIPGRAHALKEGRRNGTGSLNSGDTKIDEADIVLFVDHDVGRFQIAKENLLAVQVFQHSAQLVGPGQHPSQRQRLSRGQNLGQGAAPNIIHDHVAVAVFFDVFLNSHQMRMLEAGQNLRFLAELAQHFPAVAQIRVQPHDFDRHQTLLTLAEQDFTHAALSQDREHPIAESEHVAESA